MARQFRKIAAPSSTSKWLEPGDSYEGTLTGFQHTKLGQLANLVDDDGTMFVVSTPTRLKQLLESVNIGDYVRITYVGDIEREDNFAIKDFELLVAES